MTQFDEYIFQFSVAKNHQLPRNICLDDPCLLNAGIQTLE